MSVPSRVPTTVRNMFFEDPHFRENWEDFDQVKKSMFKESRDVWKKMDQETDLMKIVKYLNRAKT